MRLARKRLSPQADYLGSGPLADVRRRLQCCAICGRSVSIADAMRYGRLDRIERESTNTFDSDSSHARNTNGLFDGVCQVFEAARTILEVGGNLPSILEKEMLASSILQSL